MSKAGMDAAFAEFATTDGSSQSGTFMAWLTVSLAGAVERALVAGGDEVFAGASGTESNTPVSNASFVCSFQR